MGTTAYMSPEQVRNEPLDSRTDLFSFGIVLYEMTTGLRPFEGDTRAIHNAILTRDLVPAHQVNPEVSRQLGAIISRATEKDCSRRYQSAAEIRADLEAARRMIPRTRLPARFLLAAGVAALVIVTAFLWWRWHAPTTLPPNQTIVIAIVNQTRDPVFDDGLYGALQIAMEQSPYFTLLPLSKAIPAMNSLHLSGNPMRLSPEGAREVCVATGAKLVIAGSIAETGNSFGLKLRAIECGSGKTLATVSGEAPGRTLVVRELGLRAAQLRAKLQEPADSIARFNQPLETAASASPDALQRLVEGYKSTLAFDHEGAVSNYEHALDLDPNLAAALAALAAAQAYSDPESSFAAITKAYGLRDSLTERGRLEVESLYYNIVTGEREKQCAILTQFVRRFPDDFVAHNNLRLCLSYAGQPQQALAEAREARRLFPSAISYSPAIRLDLLLDRLDDAEAEFREAESQGIDHLSLRVNRALLAFQRDDRATMAQQWTRIESDPEAGFALVDKGRIEAYYGRYRSFRSLEKRAKEFAIKHHMPRDVTLITSHEAAIEAEVGNMARAIRLAEEGLKGLRSREITADLSLALALAGETARARELANVISRENSLRTEMQNFILPMIAAVSELHDAHPARAIAILERTRRYELVFSFMFCDLRPAYIRGLAYLQLGKGSLAATEFQTIIDHPGIVEGNVSGALARLQMARAMRLSGDRAAARKWYTDFLRLWNSADSDVPAYRDAKAEFAALRARSAFRN